MAERTALSNAGGTMKIDVTKIDGYAEMSAEEKVALLEGYEIEEKEPDFSGYVKKEVFDKTASELAQAKKESRQRLSEDEAKRIEQDEAMADLQAKYDKLLHNSMVAETKAKLLGLKYDEKLAEQTAEAMVSGDLDAVLKAHAKHLESFEKSLKAELLKSTPKPVGDGESNTMTLDNFRKLSAEDRLRYSQEHPEEYREMYKGGTE